MIEAQLNMFDAVVIVVLLLSTILAFFRGFVREILSLGAWVGAAMVTIYAFEPVANSLKDNVSRPLVAYLIAGLGTYIISLLAISLLNALIIRYVKSGSEVGMLDNFLGLLFGILRGGFIISLGYLVLSLIIDEDNPPIWVEQAITRPIAQQGALILASIAPEYLEDISSLSESLKEQQNSAEESEGSVSGSRQYPAHKRGDNLFDDIITEGDYIFRGREEEQGYSDKERQMLDNIIRSRGDM